MRVYRASSLGYSLEQLVAPHLGYEPIAPPEWLQGHFDEGTRLEPIILDTLRDHGWEISAEQKEVEIEVIPDRAKVVGHLDGIGGPANAQVGVVEIKSMSGKSWEAFSQHGWDAPGLVQKYKWQASAYMLAAGLPHYMVAWNKVTEELHDVYVVEPFYTLSDIALKIGEAEKHIEEGTLPEGCTDYPCPFFHLHAPSDNPVQPADEELDGLMAKWLALDDNEKTFKKQKDAIRAEMLEIAGTEATASVRGSNGVTITTTWQEEKEYMTKRKGGWVTKISPPRKVKDGD